LLLGWRSTLQEEKERQDKHLDPQSSERKMGGCLAKLFGGRKVSLTEMVSSTHKHFDNDAVDEEAGDSSAVAEQNIQISKEMSSLGIVIEGAKVKGNGLALADISVEQDSAYWEWSIDDVAEDSSGGLVKFGVCTRKNAEFYKAMAENEKNGEDVCTTMPSTSHLLYQKRSESSSRHFF
jgi:hypothetical protein